jgi:hypothetical protein
MSKGLGRNDPCWCGSGKKYKHCHLRRAAETPLPPEAIAARVRRGSAYQICLHPDASASACGQVVSAHTLQRSRVLREIADAGNHVLTFYPFQPNQRGGLTVHRRGWRNASTFEAFCDKHDSETFAPLEAVPFTGTKEQAFLIAYRAICWELYQKSRAVRSGPIRRDLVDRGAPPHMQRLAQALLGVQDAGFKKGLADLLAVKGRMDQALALADYSAFSAREFRLEGSFDVAATGAITPNRTPSGVPLQVLHDVQAETQWLAFGVDLRDTGASVVFVWFDGQPAPLKYLDEVTNLESTKAAEFLVQFFFAYCENTYFRADWWNGLSSADRRFLDALMANANPYYFPPGYDLDRAIARWQLASQIAL